MRHLGAKHDAMSDAMVETRESRNADWETVYITLCKNDNKGKEDVRFS